jgi:hypothetical protein
MHVCFSAEAPCAGNPKYEDVKVPTQHSWHKKDRMLKMLELLNYEIDFRNDVRWI